jgi:hypothetical protein
MGGTPIPRSLRAGQQRWQANPTLLVAPYYGADAGPSRAGWNAEFVGRIRHAEYPQYSTTYDVSADGRRVYFPHSGDLRAPGEFGVVMNWSSLLK